MQLEVKEYLLNAKAIIEDNSVPFFMAASIGVLFYVSDTALPLGIILALFVYPLAYGQYVEIILHNRQAPYLQIFKTHWSNYLVVSILVTSPLVVLFLLTGLLSEDTVWARYILTALVDALTVYVLPLVFILRQRLQSVSSGLKCLYENLNFSLPLILLVILPSVLGMLSTLVGFPLENRDGALYRILGYLYWLFSISVDFFVFVAATLILKEKLLRK
jgi:hypothetical protein